MEGIEDATHKAQQRQRQGRTLDAIRLFEQALELRIDLHGPESSSVKKACDNLSDILNGAALKHLQCEEYEEAKKLLQKAEMLTGPDDLISAITYNNIACYYRRKNKLRTALKYLEKAQRIEMKSRVVANPAGTRLNLCAVLSQLERHNEALEHAHAAVVLLQEELSQMEVIGDYSRDSSPETLNKMAVLAISYHNIGVEEEYLKRIPASLAAYKKGVQIAREYLGPDNDITRTLVKSCKAAQEHLDAARMKKGFSPPGIIRQGESMGGAYDALQEHKSSRRRAQSAGSQRSASATPSCTMVGERSLSRPSTAHLGAGSKSLSRTRAWVDDDRNGNASFLSVVSEKGPMRSNGGDRQLPSQMIHDRQMYSHQDQRKDGHADEHKDLGARRMNGRQRPASALGIVEHRSASSHNNYGSELGPFGGSMGGKLGPKTPRQEQSDLKVPSIRRPPSASLRQPVRAKLGSGIERENLVTQLKRVHEGKEKIQEKKSYAWEESNGLDIDDDEEDLLDQQSQNQGPSNRRVTYERPADEGATHVARPLDRPREFPASRIRENLHEFSNCSGRGGDGTFGGSDSGNGMRGGHGGMQSGPLEDDLIDIYKDSEQDDDVDDGIDEKVQESRMGTRRAQLSTRPVSASLSRPQEGIAIDRVSCRPASASITVIQERRQRQNSQRPASAAAARSAYDHQGVARTASDTHHLLGREIARSTSDSQNVVGRTLDDSLPAKAERSSLRPASASLARPASASVARPGSARPASSNVFAREPLSSTTSTSRLDEIARNNHREEREILDILSDHSEYESDLELEAEAMKLSIPSRNTNHNQRPQNSSIDANSFQNKHGAEDMATRRPERLQDVQRAVRSGHQGLDSKRAELLAQTDIGMDHSDYESEDAACGGVSGDNRSSGAEREDRLPVLEQINARINDRQYDERQVIGHSAERPSNSGRPQRPSDNKSASARQLDSQRLSRPGVSSAAAPARRDLRQAVALPDHSEYESNDDGEGLDDMSGTLKWLEDGLTVR